MANFEALIRGALAAKGSASPEERAIVYQSSRNALNRLLESNRSMTVETAVQQQKALEAAFASDDEEERGSTMCTKKDDGNRRRQIETSKQQ